MMLFTSETSLTARIAARGQDQAALKLPDNLRCVKITRHDYKMLQMGEIGEGVNHIVIWPCLASF